ncbi:DnaB-like helicase N-terminal domain-containing protein [Rhodococcus sp. BL-253-APC-6A1W]|uniref:DnaB-like helicase N-terminal domain-containing protein n=1 Tax=Rhodococcus sp. BL-253-APC-6A1W TaxID=2725307 RepID=UPI001F0E4454|nr:DnaB-like helicase N-terminal domain-containing protein [Rhodococcus sp. BL-253-APC-6A1W]
MVSNFDPQSIAFLTSSQALVAEGLLDAAILRASAVDAAAAFAHVREADFDNPSLGVIFETAAELRAAGLPHDPVIVLDELTRRGLTAGHVGAMLRKHLLDVVTSEAAASPLAVSSYACAVVSDSYRRRFEILGKSLVEASAGFAEHDLLPLLQSGRDAAVAHAGRLFRLREATGAAI